MLLLLLLLFCVDDDEEKKKRIRVNFLLLSVVHGMMMENYLLTLLTEFQACFVKMRWCLLLMMMMMNKKKKNI